MNNDTFSQTTLIKILQEKENISNEQAKDFINLYFSIIARELKNKNSVTLHGFGTFKKVWSETSTANNPAQGGIVNIPAHYRIKFIPAAAAAERINKPYAKLKAVVLKDEITLDTEKKQVQPSVSSTEKTIFSIIAPELSVPAQQQKIQQTAFPQITTQNIQEQKITTQIINRQVIQQQIIKQQIIQSVLPSDKDGEPYDPDYDSDSITADDDDIRIISRCWFIAGIAVICALMLLVILCSTLFNRCSSTVPTGVLQLQKKQKTDIEKAETISDNSYAQIAAIQYGEHLLWPYIYGANRLRHSDPDYTIPLRELILPVKPDYTLDSNDIEQAAIDAYNAYQTQYQKQPESAEGQEKRVRAVRVITDTEQLIPGFLGRYEMKFNVNDARLARILISHQNKKGNASWKK
jgi:nucleoid DNA-binding protein